MNGQNARLVASQAFGIPLGQISVWLLETFVLVEPIPSEVAIAIGTVLGGAIHFASRFFKWSSNNEKDFDDSDSAGA